MKKLTTTEEMRKKIDASFRPVIRGGEVCILTNENLNKLQEEKVEKKKGE